MATRYLTAVANSTERANMVSLVGPKNCGLIYQRDNNTLYVLDPDGAGFVAIGSGVTVESLVLADGAMIVGDASNLGAAVTMTGDVTIDNAGVSAIGAAKVLATQLGVTAGAVTASRALVADAAKSLDVLQATTSLAVGGTGVPGAASVWNVLTKRVTGLADTVATAVLTVTIPNAEHNAIIDVEVMGILGAGGAIGAGEAARFAKYQVVLARTAGVNVVAGVSAAIGGATANVAGGDAITSVVVTLGAVAGAVGASNTFTILVAITRSGAGATNHIAVVRATVLNANATGVTIA